MKVVVLGGYGFFGSRVSRLLAREAGLSVVAAGRSRSKADEFVHGLSSAHAQLVAAEVDATSKESLVAFLANVNPDVLINTCGPFQGRDYLVAECCMASGCHYIDLADARAFVCGISSLDVAAKAAGVLVVGGASSVPGLSGAVIDSLAKEFSSLHSIEIGISPGNKTERGLATIQAILSYCGESIPSYVSTRKKQTYGWTALVSHNYPSPVGSRLLTDCDVPDLQLLPGKYPDVRSVRFLAGLELPVMHLGLWGLSWMRRLRLLPNLSRFARLTKKISEWFLGYGSDAGAMHVRIEGAGLNGSKLTRLWTLLAENGDGPFVPALCSVAIVKRLMKGPLAAGAVVAPGVVSLEEILEVAEGLSISFRLEE